MLLLLGSKWVRVGFPAEAEAAGGRGGSVWMQPSCFLQDSFLRSDVHGGKGHAPNPGGVISLPELTRCMCCETDQR